MERRINVLGFAGSLREGSYNRALLRVAQHLAPESMRLEIFELDAIPLYNGDIEARGFPEPVLEFHKKIRESDALLIVTPEYNYSVPGVLKNAIDWASRPPSDSPLSRKPMAMTGVSTGKFGTARAQMHLRQIAASTNMLTLNRPMVYVANAGKVFDEQGNLTDEKAVSLIRRLLESLVDWTIRLKGFGEAKKVA